MKTQFDPNSAADLTAGIFGVAADYKKAAMALVGVPFEATTSYGAGAADGPEMIFDASAQVDLHDVDVEAPYTPGIFYFGKDADFKKIELLNRKAKKKAQYVIKNQFNQKTKKRRELVEQALKDVNAASKKVNQLVYEKSKRILADKKILGLIGGDHSVPFGALKAIGEKYKKFSILHLDAHSDTRKAYEGFQYSHASIMYNVLEEIKAVEQLVQVGIRDFCDEENQYVLSQSNRVTMFTDVEVQRRRFNGESFDRIVQEMVKNLTENVWISFDIDGLEPAYCPHTGTPVPGGLTYREAEYLILAVAESGRKIIGFDLNEVSSGGLDDGSSEWDANVGARLLYKMAAVAMLSQGLCKPRLL